MAANRADFAEFYTAAKDDCLRTVLAVTGDVHAAEEVVAEAFARAWAAWRTVSRHPAPRAWVVRTALNERVSLWRRRGREVPLADADWGAAADDLGIGGVNEDLMAALLALPLRQRQVVALRVLLGLDGTETARVLGIAPATVRVHMARALAALREGISPVMDEERQ